MLVALDALYHHPGRPLLPPFTSFTATLDALHRHPVHPILATYRCIEYSLADADLAAARFDLAKVNEDQARAREAASKVSEDGERVTAELRALDAEVAAAAAKKVEMQGHRETLIVSGWAALYEGMVPSSVHLHTVNKCAHMGAYSQQVCPHGCIQVCPHGCPHGIIQSTSVPTWDLFVLDRTLPIASAVWRFGTFDSSEHIMVCYCFASQSRKTEIAAQLAACEAEVQDLTSRISRDEQRAGGAKKDAGQLSKLIQKAQASLEEVSFRVKAAWGSQRSSWGTSYA